MSIKKYSIGGIVALAIAGTGLLGAQPVLAANPSCGGVATSMINCASNKDPKSIEQTGIWTLLTIAIQILTACVGIAAVGGIVYGSFLYTRAGDSPELVKRARDIIRDVVIGLLLYAFMFVIVNFLIPGGVFK